MKKICCLILASLLVLCSAAGAETLRLIPAGPVALPAEAGNGELSPKGFLGLSPDGKTLLLLTSEEVPLSEEEIAESAEKAPAQDAEETVSLRLPGRVKKTGNAPAPATRTVYHVFLFRDGELIPVEDNTEFGSGDPYHQMEKMKSLLPRLPGLNGLSWSDDSRYVTFSEVSMGLFGSFLSVPVIDTVSEEAWLAESYGGSVSDADFGSVCLSAVSRDGRYVYYVSLKRSDEGPFYCFCRCATGDGSREILCKTPYRDAAGYQLDSASNLVETADGSWLLSGLKGMGSGKAEGIALIRFAPTGNEWKADILPTMIPRMLSSARFVYSAAADYGLILIGNKAASQAAEIETEDSVQILNRLPAGLSKRVNLIRFHPDQDILFDVWYMQRTGETADDMKMVSGAEYLGFLQSISLGLPIVPPADYSPENELRNPGPMIYNACLSPDGRHALLAVKTNLPGGVSPMELYLLDPETMELRHVESPANVIGEVLAADSPIGYAYRPGIGWNPDGTIVLLTESGTIGFFRLAGI